MGYYSRAKGKMQPFFVEERSCACRMNGILPEWNRQRHAAASGAPREEKVNEIMARSDWFSAVSGEIPLSVNIFLSFYEF